MSRILVVGNSHTACIRNAWMARGDRWAGHDVSFFAIAGVQFTKLKVNPDLTYGPDSPSRDKLRAALLHLNGTESVDFNDYDVILRVGYKLGEGLYRALVVRYDIDGLVSAGTTGRSISREFFEDALRVNFIEDWLHPQWRDWGPDAPRLFLSPMPAISEHFSELPEANGQIWKPYLNLPPEVGAARDVFDQMMQDVLAEHGATLLRRPTEALTPIGLSKKEYSVGSVRLRDERGAHDETEVRHMNDAYGALQLEAFFAALDGNAKTAV